MGTVGCRALCVEQSVVAQAEVLETERREFVRHHGSEAAPRRGEEKQEVRLVEAVRQHGSAGVAASPGRRLSALLQA